MKFKDKISNFNKKDIFRGLSGCLTIIFVLLINGFASLIPFGFDFNKLATSNYWASFAFLLANEILVLLGMYLIQKGRDLKRKKITDIQDCIDKQRATIYLLDKVADAEHWLKDIYNYQAKLNIFEYKVIKAYNKIKAVEPKENERFYKYKKKKYDKKLQEQKFLLDQLSYIKKDNERLNLLINKADQDKIKAAEKELENTNYVFNKTKIRYKEVYWCNLLSDVEDSKGKPSSAFFNEKSEVSKGVIKYIGMGMLSSAFTTALVFNGINAFGLNTVFNLLITFLLLFSFMGRGVGLSHKNILGKYYKALESRKAIYNKMLKDLGVSKVVIEEEEDEVVATQENETIT